MAIDDKHDCFAHVAPNFVRGEGAFGVKEWFTVGGLTKRELFAAMAMQGLLSGSHPFGDRTWDAIKADIATSSVEHADALLSALTPPPAQEGAR